MTRCALILSLLLVGCRAVKVQQQGVEQTATEQSAVSVTASHKSDSVSVHADVRTDSLAVVVETVVAEVYDTAGRTIKRTVTHRQRQTVSATQALQSVVAVAQSSDTAHSLAQLSAESYRSESVGAKARPAAVNWLWLLALLAAILAVAVLQYRSMRR